MFIFVSNCHWGFFFSFFQSLLPKVSSNLLTYILDKLYCKGSEVLFWKFPSLLSHTHDPCLYLPEWSFLEDGEDLEGVERGRVGWYLLLEVVHAACFCKYSWMEVGSGHCTPYPQGVQWSYLPYCAHLCICSFFILFEGFVKKAWRWHWLNSMKRLGEHILPEMCVQFSSTKLSSTGWLILPCIPQVWNCNVVIFLLFYHWKFINECLCFTYITAI